MTGLLFSCNQNEQTPDTTDETTFTVNQDTVLVGAAGGTASVSYTVTNPRDGVSVQPDNKAGWINDFDTSVTGTLSFTVSENTDTVRRTADVTVVYGDLQDAFKVIQEKADAGEEPEPDPKSPFEITVTDVDANTATLKIIPQDKEATYDYGAVSVADLNTLPEDIMFVEEYLFVLYENTAQQNNISLEEFLSNYLAYGDMDDLQVAGLSPETEYYAYAVGISTAGEITSEFVKVPFSTEPLPTLDATMTVDINGPNVTIHVDPADGNARWYPIVFTGSGYDNASMISSAQSQIETSVLTYEIFFGAPREDVVEMITYVGTDSVAYELEAESGYTAAAFLISDDGYIQSNPVVQTFTSGAVPQSDNQLSVEYTNITGRKADFTVKTTNNDTYIFTTYQYVDEFRQMSDDEVIEYILANTDAARYPRNGDVESSVKGLREQTEYVIFAFGYRGGEANTPLLRSTFTTKEAQTNNGTVSFSYGPYYNGDEAAERYPESLGEAVGRVVFPYTADASGVDYWDFYHAIYEGDLTDLSAYPDEDVYQALRVNGNPSWYNEMLYILDYNKPYTLCGFVETDDGNFSEIVRVLVDPFTLEGCSPIDGLTHPDLALARQTPAPDILNTEITPVQTTIVRTLGRKIIPTGSVNSDIDFKKASPIINSMATIHSLPR